MISYEMYKLLHIAAIVLFFMLASVSFALPANAKPKGLAAAIGILSLLILTFGMGLAARLGLMAAWPAWATAKIIVWLLVVGGAHMIAKRAKNPLRAGLAFLFVCAFAAIYFVIFKPWSF